MDWFASAGKGIVGWRRRINFLALATTRLRRRSKFTDISARKGGSEIVSLAVRPRKAESVEQNDQFGRPKIGRSMYASACL